MAPHEVFVIFVTVFLMQPKKSLDSTYPTGSDRCNMISGYGSDECGEAKNSS